MLFSESRNDRHRRIGDRASDDHGNSAGIGDNSAEISDNSAEIGDDAAGIVNRDWSNSVPGRQSPILRIPALKSLRLPEFWRYKDGIMRVMRLGSF